MPELLRTVAFPAFRLAPGQDEDEVIAIGASIIVEEPRHRATGYRALVALNLYDTHGRPLEPILELTPESAAALGNQLVAAAVRAGGWQQ